MGLLWRGMHGLQIYLRRNESTVNAVLNASERPAAGCHRLRLKRVRELLKGGGIRRPTAEKEGKNKNGRDACACRPEFVCEVVTPR
jgi:hypothetical protein